MFVRAYCLLSVCVLLATGCRTSSLGVLPWTDDSSLPQMTKGQLNQFGDGVASDRDAVDDVTQTASGKSDVSSGPADDISTERRTGRIEARLRRGQEAIAQAGGSREASAMLSEATSSFRDVLRIDPNNADAFHGLAVVSDLNEDWDLADINYKRALAMRPDDVRLLNDQGYSYLLQNRFHEASRYLNRVLEISPNHEKAHVNLAILDIRRGNRDAALVCLERVYAPAKARDSLVALIEQHRPLMSATIHARPPVLSHNSNSLSLQGPGSHNSTQLLHGRYISGPSDVSRTQLQPVGKMGLIQTQSSVRNIGAEEVNTTPNRVFQAAIQQTVEQTAKQDFRSPLDSARSIGVRFKLPPGHQNMRPPLPASANVYNGNSVSSGGLIPQPDREHRIGTVSTMSDTDYQNVVYGQSSQYQALQQQQPVLQQPTVLSRDNQQPGSGPYTAAAKAGISGSQSQMHVPMSGQSSRGSSDVGSHLSLKRPYNSSGPLPAGSYGDVTSTGINRGVSAPGMTNMPSGINGYPEGSTQPGALNSKGSHQGTANPSVRTNVIATTGNQPPFNGGRAPAGYQNQPSGASGIQPAAAHAASLTPPYFSPSPVPGAEYREPGSFATPLDEYRAARQQLDNEYHQTLQTLRESRGGRSFQ
ncbi:MAG: hypothetical protein MK110_13850 [Fuerstiella sp.]|nr:hypothetical protein [Fuerstiella sp.]